MKLARRSAVMSGLVIDLDWAARRTIGRGFRRDVITPDAIDPDAPASFVTCVLRLPRDLADRLEAIATTIASTQPGHYVCPAESIHVTVCGPLPACDPMQIEAAVADLRALAPSVSRCRLRVARISIGDTSAFASIEVDPEDFLALRHELARRWGVVGRGGLSGTVAAGLLWANLIRFREAPSAALVDAVARRRHPAHRGFPIESIELVCINRIMAPAMTSVLARVDVR